MEAAVGSYIVHCPSCATANRVSADHAGQVGACGGCHKPLPILYVTPLHLSGEDFDNFVGSYPLPVLVEFWAPWCPHCRALAPVLQAVAGDLAGSAAVVQVNTDAGRDLAGRFAVHGIPVMFAVKRGMIQSSRSGMLRRAELVEWFRAAVGL